MFIHMQIDILDILFINFPFAQFEKRVTELLISPRLRTSPGNKCDVDSQETISKIECDPNFNVSSTQKKIEIASFACIIQKQKSTCII